MPEIDPPTESGNGEPIVSAIKERMQAENLDWQTAVLQLGNEGVIVLV